MNTIVDEIKTELPRFTCRICKADSDAYQVSVYQYIEFLSCQTCGSVTTTPIPETEELEASIHSARNAQLAPFPNNRERNHYLAHLQDLKKASRGSRFINLNAHNGLTTEMARTTVFPDTVGIDGNRFAIEIAEKRFHKNRFIHSTVKDFAKTGETYDTAVILHGLSMTNDPDDYLEDVKKILNDGAAVYISLCDGNHLMTPNKIMKWREARYPDRVFYLSRSGLDLILKRHGFKVLKRYKRYLPYQHVIARYKKTI